MICLNASRQVTMKQQSFFQSVIRIAIPVALQSMLQSSFSMIDQVMVGQLGSTSIAAVGIAGKFAFLYSVVIGAVLSPPPRSSRIRIPARIRSSAAYGGPWE